MAIFTPGKRNRHNRRVGNTSRSVVVMLSLTAMVDMFTVLVVFLLQNYNSTGEVIYLPKEVQLPEAKVTKELKPAFVVTVSDKEVSLDKEVVATTESVKSQQDWLIQPLFQKLQDAMQKKLAEAQSNLSNPLKQVVQNDPNKPADPNAKPVDPLDEFRKITVQADKRMDFLTVKKVMFTVTEAGAAQINFAVIKRGE